MWRAVAAALLAAAATSSCGGADPYTDYEPAPPEQRAPRPGARLTATIIQLPTALRITYRLVNTGPVPLVVYDGQPTGNDAAISASAYVTARRDGTVEIAKRTFTVPPGEHPTGLNLLRGTILRSGQAVTETLDVALPLVPLRTYVEPKEMRLPDPVRRVVFCLGVTRQDALPERLRNGVAQGGGSPTPSPEDPVYPHPSPQHLFCSAVKKLDPPV